MSQMPSEACADEARLIQKQPIFGVLHYPFHAIDQVLSRHGTACHYVPFVALDRVEVQSLTEVLCVRTS